MAGYTEQRLIPFPLPLFPYFFEQWSSLHYFHFTEMFFSCRTSLDTGLKTLFSHLMFWSDAQAFLRGNLKNTCGEVTYKAHLKLLIINLNFMQASQSQNTHYELKRVHRWNPKFVYKEYKTIKNICSYLPYEIIIREYGSTLYIGLVRNGRGFSQYKLDSLYFFYSCYRLN